MNVSFYQTKLSTHRLALGEGSDAQASGMKPTELCQDPLAGSSLLTVPLSSLRLC